MAVVAVVEFGLSALVGHKVYSRWVVDMVGEEGLLRRDGRGVEVVCPADVG